MDGLARRWSPGAAKVASLGIAYAAAWTFSLPLYVDAALAIGLLCAALRARAADVALLAAALVGCASALHLGFLAAGDAVPRFYREHERFKRLPERVYAPNVDVVIEQPHGDLLAVDPLADPAIREPRTIRFRTDSAGYRNPYPYRGQRTVLAGDSFVVGNGNDEADTLRAILLDEHGIDAYSLAFPDDPVHYAQKTIWLLGSMSRRARFLFFFFEGNDFETSEGEPVLAVRARMFPRVFGELLDRYDDLRTNWLRAHAPWLHYPPRMLAMARLVERHIALRGASSVAVRKVGPKPVGFYEVYNLAAVDSAPTLPLDLDARVLQRTACVFFIPTKLRTYAFALEPEVRARLASPAPGYRVLERTFAPHGIPVIDLTGPLAAEAERLLPLGEYVFWRDDTHWNGHGMRAVAPMVAHCAADERPPGSP